MYVVDVISAWNISSYYWLLRSAAVWYVLYRSAVDPHDLITCVSYIELIFTSRALGMCLRLGGTPNRTTAALGIITVQRRTPGHAPVNQVSINCARHLILGPVHSRCHVLLHTLTNCDDSLGLESHFNPLRTVLIYGRWAVCRYFCRAANWVCRRVVCVHVHVSTIMQYLCIVHVYMYMHTYALCGYTCHLRTCRYAAIP